MEELHSQRALACYDVALKALFRGESFSPDAVTKALRRRHDGLDKFVGFVYPYGTCFIVLKLTYDIYIGRERVAALALTNFHVGYDLLSKTRNSCMFVTFDKNRKLNYTSCEPLIEFNSLYPEPNQSMTTKENYCYSSDLALLAIYDFPGSDALITIPFEDYGNIDINRRVSVTGHPCTSNYDYVLPGKEDSDNEKIFRGFHKFKKQIISKGKIIGLSDSGLMDLQLSATTGMSGSPVLKGHWPNCKIIGIYCGGPPLKGQYLITQAMGKLIEHDYKAFFKICKRFPIFDPSLYLQTGSFIFVAECIKTLKNHLRDEENKNSRNFQERLTIFVNDALNALQSCLNSTVIHYQDRESLVFNAAISVNSKCFSGMKSLLNKFKEFPGGNFANVEKLMQTINLLS